MSELFRYSPQPRKENAPLSHRWFVDCKECYGYGWFAETVPGTENDYIPDYNERYCDCEAGKWRRIYDGAELPWERVL